MVNKKNEPKEEWKKNQRKTENIVFPLYLHISSDTDKNTCRNTKKSRGKKTTKRKW
jgi:hypothetical protein